MGAERNKAMLFELYEAARAKDSERIADLLAEDFVEHSPQVAYDSPDTPGKRAFLNQFTGDGTPFDDAEVDIRRVIADDEHVVVHYRLAGGKYPGGVAVVDVFRVAEGRFAEHWDVIQAVPERSANPHEMF